MAHNEPRWQKTFVVYIAYGVHPKCGGYFPTFVILESGPVVLPFKEFLFYLAHGLLETGMVAGLRLSNNK